MNSLALALLAGLVALAAGLQVPLTQLLGTKLQRIEGGALAKTGTTTTLKDVIQGSGPTVIFAVRRPG